MSAVNTVFVFLDFGRFGAFALCILSIIDLAFNFPTDKNKRLFALVGTGTSFLGFAGVFLTSVSSLFNTAVSMISNISGYIGADEDAIAAAMFAPWTVGCIFFMVAVAGLAVSIVMSYVSFAPKAPKVANVANPYGQPVAPVQQTVPQPVPVQQVVPQPTPVQQVAPQPTPVQQTVPQPASAQQVAPQPDTQAAPWFCTNCGTQNSALAKFCKNCGTGKDN